MPVIQTVNIISQLATKYGLQYAKVLVQGQAPTPPDDETYSAGIAPYTAAYHNSDTPIATSPLGTPVFTNIVFTGNTINGVPKKNGTPYKNPVTGVEYAFDDVEFQTVLISVSQAKKIVKTEIQGRDGTIKEYIGLDDYHITVNAIINGANLAYPSAQVTAMKKMLDAPVTIDVTCKYLNDLGIHSVAIESYQIEQQEGMYSQQRVTINCISDTPIILQVNGY